MIQAGSIQMPREVLVVDDYETNRHILGNILADGYNVTYAADGKEALEIMRARADTLSIVLLDLIMPVMTGFEVLEVVHDDEQLKSIPIIVLTAEREAELEALQLGAADFITKPFDVHEVVLARVERIIELSEGRQLISAAENDRLTQLYNRNFFIEYANRLVQHRSELRFDAIVIDIEQFHSVNDVSGRDFGDKVLCTIADEIRAFLATTEGIASRFEADRFDIFCVQQDDYRTLLDRIQQRVNELSPNVNIHVRMGVQPWWEGLEPVAMFDRAHTACKSVRGNFQKPLMVYDEAMHRREQFNQRLLNDLRLAVEHRQLKVFYQPKYNVQCNPPMLCSAEALIRWQHPELGMMFPGDFVPLFEGNGLIGIVDGYVCQEAVRQVVQWKRDYGITLPVSVNLSRSDVFDPTLVSRLEDLVVSNGLSFDDILLEVTESAYADNAALVLDTINALRNVGFNIEMDDFGSGYSSLNMLSDMPFDVLKMDMRFVRNIEKSTIDLHLVKLILDIARYLNVVVVAEGVETQGQLDLLRDAGCDVVQGYYFSKPLSAQEFEKLIVRELGGASEG